MIIHIFVSTPRRRSETGRNYSYVRFYAPTETGSGVQSFIYLFLRPDIVWVRRNIEVICPKPINIGSNKEYGSHNSRTTNHARRRFTYIRNLSPRVNYFLITTGQIFGVHQISIVSNTQIPDFNTVKKKISSSILTDQDLK